MGAADVMLQPKAMRPAVQPLIQNGLSTSKAPASSAFDPKLHLKFEPPSKTYTMKDLDLPEDTGVSRFAVSEPFPLFAPEAVHQMRREILSEEVWNNCQYSSNLSQCQLRGFAPK